MWSEIFRLCRFATATPDDTCPICLESMRPIGSSHSVKDCEPSTKSPDRLLVASSRNSSPGDERAGTASPTRPAVDHGSMSCVDFAASNARSRGNDETYLGTEKPVVKLAACGHFFHRECIYLYLHYTDRGGLFCPTCNALQAPGNGPSPPGETKQRGSTSCCGKVALLTRRDASTVTAVFREIFRRGDGVANKATIAA